MAPYKSSAQQKYFHYLESKGKMPKKVVNEFDESTDFGDLPERKANGGIVGHQEYDTLIPKREMQPMPGYAYGGMIEPEENFDWDKGHESEYDSAGEPNTEDDLESDHPMEFMARGGRVKRMANGGMIRKSNFAKALRKAY